MGEAHRMDKLISLSLDALTLDAEVQPRESMSSQKIEDYAALYRDGITLPPVVAFHDGKTHWVADGFHRVSAARQTTLTTIAVHVHMGSKMEAIVYACGANKHGLTLTQKDKQRVVKRTLELMGQWSDREIARHCGVAHSFVGKQRLQLSGLKNQIRTVRRGTTIYDMDTTEINHQADDTAPLYDIPRASIEVSYPARPGNVPLVLVQDVSPPNGKPSHFNRTTEMVDWAKWTWNPVTGCLHNCVYCYARDIAEDLYPEKFTPSFHPERLTAPYYTKVPAEAEENIGYRNVFVCSMADLFGKWVPQEWIDAILEAVRQAPQWNFLFLTKFPQRLASIEWPENAWVGTSVDEQYRVEIAEKAFRKVQASVKWLSVEPMRERLTFTSLEMFDWVVIGGQSKSSQAPAFQPPWEWVEHLMQQARRAGCLVYWKPNLHTRPQEYPDRR